MGCDIHLHVEVEIDGRWEHYSHLTVARNYEVFDMMAGVRHDDDHTAIAISPPRGLPNDITFLTRLDADKWAPDAHDASWLSGDEAVQVQRFADKKWSNEYTHPPIFGYLFGNYLNSWKDGLHESMGGRITDCRIVFWFDN
jgi:hypothetical protein